MTTRSLPLGRWHLVGLAALPLVPACQGDHLTPAAPIEPAGLYWDLALNHHAVTLSTTAPYDTLTLTATPRNPEGEALTGFPVPSYRSTKPEQVLVTAGGVLVAVKLTPQPVLVIATLTAGNLKHEDTVLVRVVDAPTPPALGTLSIHPVPPDSAKFGMDLWLPTFSYLLNRLVYAADTGGVPMDSMALGDELVNVPWPPAPITDLLVSFRSSDTTIASVTHTSNNGMQIFRLTGRRPGTVTLYASATAFGITKADTLSFRIGLPVDNKVVVAFDDGRQAYLTNNSTVRVGVGGLVRWSLRNGADVTFSDPTNVAAADNAASFLSLSFLCSNPFVANPCTAEGNIASSTDLVQSQARVFPVPGTYEYRSTIPGISESFSGRVIVVDER